MGEEGEKYLVEEEKGMLSMTVSRGLRRRMMNRERETERVQWE